jgi:hypothetical protein
MKNVNLVGTFLVSLVMLSGVTGCQHKPVAPTPIPDWARKGGAGNSSQDNAGGTIANPNGPGTTGEPLPIDYSKYGPLFDGAHNEDRDKFKADTVYFDFDSSTVKPSEESKLNDVANYFKGNDKFEGLIIEGNCDERGTENTISRWANIARWPFASSCTTSEWMNTASRLLLTARRVPLTPGMANPPGRKTGATNSCWSRRSNRLLPQIFGQ